MSISELKEYYRKIIEEKLKQFKKYEMKIYLSDYNYIQITVKDEKGEEIQTMKKSSHCSKTTPLLKIL